MWRLNDEIKQYPLWFNTYLEEGCWICVYYLMIEKLILMWKEDTVVCDEEKGW